jgi:hypothetical protein
MLPDAKEPENVGIDFELLHKEIRPDGHLTPFGRIGVHDHPLVQPLARVLLLLPADFPVLETLFFLQEDAFAYFPLDLLGLERVLKVRLKQVVCDQFLRHFLNSRVFERQSGLEHFCKRERVLGGVAGPAAALSLHTFHYLVRGLQAFLEGVAVVQRQGFVVPHQDRKVAFFVFQ